MSSRVVAYAHRNHKWRRSTYSTNHEWTTWCPHPSGIHTPKRAKIVYTTKNQVKCLTVSVFSAEIWQITVKIIYNEKKISPNLARGTGGVIPRQTRTGIYPS